jgi:hypothetical protein
MRYYRKIVFSIIILTNCLFAQRIAYVINGNSETLSRINLLTGYIENHVVTTGPVPNQIVYYDRFLYVVNSGSASLQIIDPSNAQTIDEIALPINSNPLNVALYAQYAFVTGFATSQVYKIDLASRSLIDSITVGLSPAGIIVYNQKLYVTNTGFNQINYAYGQGSVSILDLPEGQLIGQMNVGKNPQALVVSPDSFVNVICTGNYSTVRGRIYFIDSRSNIVTDSLITGGDPNWPCINAIGTAYVSCGGWSGYGIVISYDAITRTIIRGISNPIQVGLGAMGLAMDSSGNLYSTGQMANAVTSFSQQGQILATYPVGSGPVSIAIVDRQTSIDNTDANPPNNFSLGKPYPNPFNSSIIIPLRGHGNIYKNPEIEIYDVTGRLVKRLSAGRLDNMTTVIIWDAVDYRENPVSSGVYYAHIKGTSEYAKMVLTR